MSNYQALFIIQQMISLNILKCLLIFCKNSKILLEFQFSAFLPKVAFYIRHFGVKRHLPFLTLFTNTGFDVFVGHHFNSYCIIEKSQK